MPSFPSNSSLNIVSYYRTLISTRELHISPPHNSGFLGLLATLLESPSASEPTFGPEQAAVGLGALALAAQDSRKRSPTITTLSPERLTPTEVIHLPCEARTLTVSFKPLSTNTVASSTATLMSSTNARAPSSQPVPHLTPNGKPYVPHAVTLRAASGASDVEGVHFPTGLGCLYYHAPPAPCTPLAGALRLRTLPSLDRDPRAWTNQAVRDAFALGHDFCVLPGIAWHVPVLARARGARVRRLVAPGVMGDAEREGRQWSVRQLQYGSRVVHGFGQAFVVDLGTRRPPFCFVGRRSVHEEVLPDFCSWDQRGSDEVRQSLTGRLICAFERRKGPGHSRTPDVAIRVRTVLSPVRRNPQYSGPLDLPLPSAGLLLTVRKRASRLSSATHRGKRQSTPWLANGKTKGMQVLFENDSKGMRDESARRGL